MRARTIDARRAFLLERGTPLDVVVTVSLASPATVPIYPLRSTSHILMEWAPADGAQPASRGSAAADALAASGDTAASACSEVVEVAVEETLRGGQARLLKGVWDPERMLQAAPSGVFHMHIFAQVRSVPVHSTYLLQAL